MEEPRESRHSAIDSRRARHREARFAPGDIEQVAYLGIGHERLDHQFRFCLARNRLEIIGRRFGSKILFEEIGCDFRQDVTVLKLHRHTISGIANHTVKQFVVACDLEPGSEVRAGTGFREVMNFGGETVTTLPDCVYEIVDLHDCRDRLGGRDEPYSGIGFRGADCPRAPGSWGVVEPWSS